MRLVVRDDSQQHKSDREQDLLVGSLLAIFGNILISISLNLQKYVHLRNAKREVAEQKHYTKERLWWCGMLLMVLGELFNFTAYGFAPASVVAPLGTTTVVANLFLAAIFLKERIRSENLFGCALAVIGAILLVTFSRADEKVMGSYEIIQSLCQPMFIAYVCIEVIILAVLLSLLYYQDMKHVLIYLLISSITASFTIISAKAVSGMLQLSVSSFSEFGEPVFYAMLAVLVVTALIQIKFVNLAMKSYDATVVVPVNFVIFTVSAILAGIIFYKEFYGMNGLRITMFIFGCLLSFLGVYFIAVGKTDLATPGKQDVAPQQITSDLIPSWMLANVNVGQVQPTGSVEHLKDTGASEDQVPILHAAETLETIEEQTEESAEDRAGNDTDEISVSSSDRERDGPASLTAGQKQSYGATDKW